MTLPRLHVDQNQKVYILDGDLNAILNNRRLRYYFKDVLKADFDTDGKIAISYQDDERRDEILRAIHEAVNKYGLEVIDSQAVEHVSREYFLEKERFAVFSQKAKG